MKASLDASTIPFVLARQLLARSEKQESLIRASAQEALAKTMQMQVEQAVSEAETEPFVISALSIPSYMLEIGGAKLSVNNRYLLISIFICTKQLHYFVFQ